ncbi:hypothetical protein JVT61DRAFT_3267 [Boletus reticuloceps]|uniref:Uncharacterized protein n=1 Tax=Boletus reticuloceps TaxID=495285 RepID=A0A8I3A9Y7_9AGAM|nr:hypothetical protein JVT61DRAFT_3267 [Boletus reticuloceps]
MVPHLLSVWSNWLTRDHQTVLAAPRMSMVTSSDAKLGGSNVAVTALVSDMREVEYRRCWLDIVCRLHQSLGPYLRERTADTMTLLKLCETTTIRTYLREISILDTFISQLRRENSALSLHTH